MDSSGTAGRVQEKKAAKKSAQSTRGNDTKDAVQATKPPIERGGEGEEEGDLNARLRRRRKGKKMGPRLHLRWHSDAVRYNGKKEKEDIAHATPIKPADPEQEHRIEEEEEEEEEEEGIC